LLETHRFELGPAQSAATGLIFVWFGIDPQLVAATILVPVTAIGHAIGMKAHQSLIENDRLFKRPPGLAMIAIAAIGIWRLP